MCQSNHSFVYPHAQGNASLQYTSNVIDYVYNAMLYGKNHRTDKQSKHEEDKMDNQVA